MYDHARRPAANECALGRGAAGGVCRARRSAQTRRRCGRRRPGRRRGPTLSIWRRKASARAPARAPVSPRVRPATIMRSRGRARRGAWQRCSGPRQRGAGSPQSHFSKAVAESGSDATADSHLRGGLAPIAPRRGDEGRAGRAGEERRNGRGPDAGRTIGFEGTDADRTRTGRGRGRFSLWARCSNPLSRRCSPAPGSNGAARVRSAAGNGSQGPAPLLGMVARGQLRCWEW
eukprot:gene9446-biopygen176